MYRDAPEVRVRVRVRLTVRVRVRVRIRIRVRVRVRVKVRGDHEVRDDEAASLSVSGPHCFRGVVRPGQTRVYALPSTTFKV